MPNSPPVFRIGGKEATSEGRRENSHQRGYTRQWNNASHRFLAENPHCRLCKEKGIAKLATDTDHIIPHRGNMALFWDTTNWQPLCKECHSKKTQSGR